MYGWRFSPLIIGYTVQASGLRLVQSLGHIFYGASDMGCCISLFLQSWVRAVPLDQSQTGSSSFPSDTDSPCHPHYRLIMVFDTLDLDLALCVVMFGYLHAIPACFSSLHLFAANIIGLSEYLCAGKTSVMTFKSVHHENAWRLAPNVARHSIRRSSLKRKLRRSNMDLT